MNNSSLFIGIMTGTSCDGIDVAIVRFSEKPELLYFIEHPMPEDLREPLLRLASPGMNEIDTMGEFDVALGQAIARAVLESIRSAGLKASDITAIGNHGQTIRHRPRARHPFTLQIGSAAAIAEKTGITTISDFRSRDMAAGGQGAPLVPFAHQRLFASQNQNTVIVNIGGIANVSWLGANGDVFGFDTGPGNMIMDGLMLALSDGRHAYDSQGELAASGNICSALLDALMDHPFLHRPPPKSTGREEFGEKTVELILSWPELIDADRMATANAFTVQSIINGMAYFPEKVSQCYICGGGVRNNHMMRQLQDQLAPIPVNSTEAAGIPPQAVEAVSFAILARQTLMGEKNTLPEVTGAGHGVCGGQIIPGNNWKELLRNIPAWTR